MSTNKPNISTASVLHIIETIKAIQRRMKDPDNINAEYIRVYDNLGKEFPDFFEKYTGIFTKVIRGEKLDVLASALYYQDKINQGLMTESELSEMLATKYLPAHLKSEADTKMKNLPTNESIQLSE